jgi:hypothetical protein
MRGPVALRPMSRKSAGVGFWFIFMGLGAKINVLMIRPAMQNCLQLFTRLLNSIYGVFDLVRSGLLIAAIGAAIVTTGCTSAVNDTQRAWMNTVFKPYVPDVVQGNFISSERFAKFWAHLYWQVISMLIAGTTFLNSSAPAK